MRMFGLLFGRRTSGVCWAVVTMISTIMANAVPAATSSMRRFGRLGGWPSPELTEPT
jgi:hypothetical protein